MVAYAAGRMVVNAALAAAVLAAGTHAQGYRRIFDGASLKGWHATGKGSWTVADSVLIGTLAPGNPESYLISDFQARDFSLRLKFRWMKGNGGVNFRNEQRGDLSLGIQADIEGPNTSGWLYDNVKAAYVARNDSTPKWYKANAWNDLLIEADSARITVFLNGRKTVDYLDAGGRRQGVFAFQLHGGQDMDVRFKEIEFRDHAVSGVGLLKTDPGRREAAAGRGRSDPSPVIRGLVRLTVGSWSLDGSKLEEPRDE